MSNTEVIKTYSLLYKNVLHEIDFGIVHYIFDSM